MRVDLFDFELPAARIAQRPAVPRDSARLLQVARGGLAHRQIRDLPGLLRPGDLLVLNDTRVLPARLRGVRPGGGGRQDVSLELLLLRRLADGGWSAMARPVRRLRAGDRLHFGDGSLSAKVTGVVGDGQIELRFEGDDAAVHRALREHGAMPLPPYIRDGVADQQDRSDYQTVVARRDGAVAAPTAGLHFTDDLLAALAARGIAWATVTLHVGAGTFQPVRAEDTDQHLMATEWGEIGPEAAEAVAMCRARGGRIVAIGTTALRLLETVAAAHDGAVVPWSGDTSLFIVPGYRFGVADLLLTNFHLPRSTLFMLVAAFAGLETMHAAYAEAIAAGYRFYSYGDACLLERAALS
jgi:S-adenosylmethionine:tRNA ribosyltransferase-isomerase